MTTRMTEFKEGETYRNRLGEYTVLQIFDDGTMTVICKYGCNELKTFNQRFAQMTIFNLNRGK